MDTIKEIPNFDKDRPYLKKINDILNMLQEDLNSDKLLRELTLRVVGQILMTGYNDEFEQKGEPNDSIHIRSDYE